VASRRQGKGRRELFGTEPEELSPSEAADLIYGDPDLLDEIERQRVIRRPVSLEEISEDPAIQVRVGGLDADHVEALVQVLLNGGSFKDPIELVRDDESGALLLAAGFHRCAATRLALERAEEPVTLTDKLDARIHQSGGRAKALEIAEEDNLRHGLKLTTRDKRHIFERRLARGHDWVRWSNRRQAAELGVDEATIRNWRKVLTAEFSAVEPTQRVGADGRVYDVSGIQEASQERVADRDDDHQTGASASRSDVDTAARPRGDWRVATRREIVSHLRQAAAGLRKLQDSGADAMARYADTLEEEWSLNEHD
jgi:hypothetical protein